MQTFAIAACKMQRLLVCILPGIMAFFFCATAAAQQARIDTTHVIADTSTTDNTARKITGDITSFDGFDMPEEMAMRLRSLTPEGILMFHDEFQVTRDGDYGQEIDLIKIWYIDDHFVGYLIATPLEGGGVHKRKIDIPALWCCTPAAKGHDEHCVGTVAQMRASTADNKCSGWYIKLPDEYMPTRNYIQPNAKKQRRGKKEGFQTN